MRACHEIRLVTTLAGRFLLPLPGRLRRAGTFTGGITNRENIGNTSEQLYLEWDEKLPDDQVESSAN